MDDHRRKRLKKASLLTVFAVLIGAPLMFCICCLRWAEMMSSSMEPTIMGRGSSPTRQGDFVFYFRCCAISAVRTNDLALVRVTNNSGTPFTTILRVAEITEATNQSLTRQQYRMTADSTNGLDSNHFGLLPEDCIVGKVFYVLRSQSLTNGLKARPQM